MKNTLSIIIVSLTISCTSFKDYRNQEYKLIENGKQSFVIKNNLPLLDITINNQNRYFLFDTGANTSIITDSVFLNKIKSETNFKKSNSLTNASGFTVDSYKIVVEKITSPVFDSKNIILSYFKLGKNSYNSKTCKNNNINEIISEAGIIGLNNFINSDKTIYLNFDNNSIEILNENCDKKGFNEISVIFNKLNKKIIIPIILNNKKIDFLFDTGNNSGLLIKDSELKNLNADYEGEMILGNFNGYSVQKIKTFKNMAITNFPINIQNQDITSFNPFLTNTMGMKFISKFNWLLDFKNQKIYVQKNQNLFEKNSNNINSIQSIVIENKLLIGFKSTSIIKFKINDEIISINNTPITSENICEMQNLLNSTKNWDQLNIEIKKP